MVKKPWLVIKELMDNHSVWFENVEWEPILLWMLLASCGG